MLIVKLTDPITIQGSVVGPNVAVDDRIAVYDGTTGAKLKDGGYTIAEVLAAASGDVTGPASSTDNHIATFDGTTGKIIQDGGSTIADITGAIPANISDLNNDSLIIGTDVQAYDAHLASIAGLTPGSVGNMITSTGSDAYQISTPSDVRTALNVEDGAEANNISDINATDLTDSGDTSLHYHSSDRNRANHTGTQTASTISDFDTEVSNNTDVSSNTSFRTTPSTIITAGDNISWNGNTLNVSATTIDNLDDISDVVITTPADNEVLAYDTSSEDWINQTPAEAGLATASDLSTHTGDSTIHFTQANISITASQVSDFDTEVSNNTDVTANSAKVTNATHTGEVTGSGELTIADNIIDESNMHISNAPTNDYVLTADNTADGGWKWAESSGGFSDPMTTRGDMIIRNSANTTTRLAVGPAGTVLKSDGTDVSWGTAGTSLSKASSAEINTGTDDSKYITPAGIAGSNYKTLSEIQSIKLDDFATPDDNTDLNASTSRHGLLPKLDGTTTKFLNGAGAWTTPAGGSGTGFSTGDIKWTCRTTADTGFLICDGSAVSRTTYSDLFTIISTSFGAGDGSTTFNLPDFRARVPVVKSTDTEFDTLGKEGGAKTHQLITSEMPAHTHTFSATYNEAVPYVPPVHVQDDPTGIIEVFNSSPTGSAGGITDSTGGDGYHNNLQPYLVVSTAQIKT